MESFFSILPYSRTLRQLGSIAYAAMLLMACGGSSGGDATAPAASASLSGTFVDSPVQGLGYKALPSGLAGKTDATGNYQYMPGDMVTFDIGGRGIGTVIAGPQVTALSVFGATSITDHRVVNLSQLLLTLGGIPPGQNPIQLPATIPAGLPNLLNFSDPNFTTMLQNALLGTTVVTPAQATIHLQTSFKTLAVTVVNSGTVTSDPAGINCTVAGTCSFAFVAGTPVTLTASGSGFTGWSGGVCSGTRTCLVTLNTDTTVTALFSTSTTGSAYPLRIGPTGRYLVDQQGVPFLMVGESPQAMIGNLSLADAGLFLVNRRSYGFNTVWISLLCKANLRCQADGSTFDGIVPFTVADDLSTPNESYFARADQMIQLAAQYGFLVILDPIETSGWLSVLQSNGVTKARAYGQYLGTRYKDFPNIVWMSGNDFQTWNSDPSGDALVRAVALGIKDTDPNHIHTVELNYNVSSSLDDSFWAPIISLNAAYTYFPTYADVLRAYNQSASMPVFMVEANYEFENNTRMDPSTPAILRRQEYWTALSGATGQLYGNCYTWNFRNGNCKVDDWKTQLDTPGAVQIGYLKALFAPRAWYNLVPDQTNTVVTGDPSDPNSIFSSTGSIGANDYVTAARTPSGKLVMAYVPSTQTITVDMSQLAGPTIASWYDPTVGTFTSIAGSPFANAGSSNFTTPGTNARGDEDWVLILEVP